MEVPQLSSIVVRFSMKSTIHFGVPPWRAGNPHMTTANQRAGNGLQLAEVCLKARELPEVRKMPAMIPGKTSKTSNTAQQYIHLTERERAREERRDTIHGIPFFGHGRRSQKISRKLGGFCPSSSSPCNCGESSSSKGTSMSADLPMAGLLGEPRSNNDPTMCWSWWLSSVYRKFYRNNIIFNGKNHERSLLSPQDSG